MRFPHRAGPVIFRHPETEYQQTREALTVATVGLIWGCETKLTRAGHTCDCGLYRTGVLVAIGEVKGRDYPRTKYPGGLMLTARKWDCLGVEGRGLRVPALVFDRGPDGITQWVAVDPCRVAKRGPGGRWDRNDPADRSEHVWIEWHQFHGLERKPEWLT